MSEAKHTPGPWKARATGLARSGKIEHEIHWSDDGECIAEIVHGEPEAHLIAAAPDLLESLDTLFNLANHFNVSGVYFTEDSENREALEQAERAIAKAKGESQ